MDYNSIILLCKCISTITSCVTSKATDDSLSFLLWTLQATCWVRELINNFIHGASPSALNRTLPTASTQGNDADAIKRNIVQRLRNLIELEDELKHTSSKCYNFAPPGKRTKK